MDDQALLQELASLQGVHFYLCDLQTQQRVCSWSPGEAERELPRLLQSCELVGHDEVHADDVALVQRFWEQRHQADCPPSRELDWRWLPPERDERWLRMRERVLARDPQGVPTRVLGSLQDVSFERQVTSAAESAEARYRTILEAIPDLVLHFDSEGNYASIHEGREADLLRPKRELLGRHFRDVLPVELAEQIEQGLVEAERDAKVVTVEYELPFADGRVEWYEARMAKTTGDQHVALVRNMTERRVMELSLRRINSFYETLVQNAAEGIAAVQPSTRSPGYEVLLWNERLETFTGVDADRLNIGGGLAELAGDAAQGEWLHRRMRAMLAGEEVRGEEWQVQHVDGSLHLLTVSSTHLKLHREPPTTVLFVQDITEKRQTEQRLAERDAFIAQIANASPDVISVFDLIEQRSLYRNRRFQEMLGYDDHGEAENEHENFVQWLHPEDAEGLQNLQSRWDQVADGEFLEAKFRLLAADGTWRWFWSRDTAFERLSDGRVKTVIGTAKDVTEWKLAEDRLLETRAFLERVIAATPDFIFAFDVEQRQLIFCNGTLPAALGYDSTDIEQMAPELFHPIIHPDELPQLAAAWDELQQTDAATIKESEWRVKATSGQYHTLLARTTGLATDETGRIKQVVGTVKDISDWREAELALRESESRLRGMLEDLDQVAVQAYELDGTITYWNRASEQLFEVPARAAIGKRVFDVPRAEAKAEQLKSFVTSEPSSSGHQTATELEVTRQDGSTRLVYSNQVLQRRPGQSAELYCFDIDISERLRYEEELVQRQAELLHASRLTTVGQMVATFSHEIAQPLSATGNFAAACEQLLQASEFAGCEQVRKLVEKIRKQNRQAGEILQRLRDFSRRATRKRESCSLETVVRESVNLLSSELRRFRVRVREEYAESPAFVCDRVLLQQLFVNLLNNACEAMQDLPETRRVIDIRLDACESEIIAEVSDAGEGVTDEQLERLFESFYTTKEHGMGIGLSICQTIAADHDGRLEAERNPHHGMTFRLRLPHLRQASRRADS